MARSYKRTPGWCDRSPYHKRQANKKVRRTRNIPSGGSYKKVYCSYKICDTSYLHYWPGGAEREAWEDYWENQERIEAGGRAWGWVITEKDVQRAVARSRMK